VGRFLNPDPIGFAGGLNLYAYVENDPANAVDPTGHADMGLLGLYAAKTGAIAPALRVRCNFRAVSRDNASAASPAGVPMRSPAALDLHRTPGPTVRLTGRSDCMVGPRNSSLRADGSSSRSPNLDRRTPRTGARPVALSGRTTRAGSSPPAAKATNPASTGAPASCAAG
jgi:uncharacterized protein RhaS with RHS repeats